MWNTAEKYISLIICGKAFQNSGPESENALKPNCLLVCFSAAIITEVVHDSS